MPPSALVAGLRKPLSLQCKCHRKNMAWAKEVFGISKQKTGRWPVFVLLRSLSRLLAISIVKIINHLIACMFITVFMPIKFP